MAYIFSHFYWVFLAVLAAPLQAEISATAAHLSAASGYCFLAFALMQIPVGLALDTLGPERTNAALLAIRAGDGAMVFAAATAPWHISLTMALIVIGCSPVLMASYYVVARGFSSANLATMAAFILGIGSLGNISASFPLTLLVELFGWRLSIVMIGVSTAVVASLCYLSVKAPPQGHYDTKRQRVGSTSYARHVVYITHGFGKLCTSRRACGLWIGPYLTDAFGSPVAQVGTVTTIMALAMIAGNFFYGPLDRLFGPRNRSYSSAI